MKKKEIVDCHYCEYAICMDKNSNCDCYAEDDCYFDHHVKNSKEEAENCNMFKFCDIFPKL